MCQGGLSQLLMASHQHALCNGFTMLALERDELVDPIVSPHNTQASFRLCRMVKS